MKEISKEEMDKTIEEYLKEDTSDLWLLIMLWLIFTPSKPDKVINIYMGDDK